MVLVVGVTPHIHDVRVCGEFPIVLAAFFFVDHFVEQWSLRAPFHGVGHIVFWSRQRGDGGGSVLLLSSLCLMAWRWGRSGLRKGTAFVAIAVPPSRVTASRCGFATPRRRAPPARHAMVSPPGPSFFARAIYTRRLQRVAPTTAADLATTLQLHRGRVSMASLTGSEWRAREGGREGGRAERREDSACLLLSTQDASSVNTCTSACAERLVLYHWAVSAAPIRIDTPRREHCLCCGRVAAYDATT